MRKKVDSRIKALVEQGIATRQRIVIGVVGDRGREQVVNFHYLLQKLSNTKTKILWCYNRKLGFHTDERKRQRTKKSSTDGVSYDPAVDDPWELFLSTADIRWCKYGQSFRILGQTFGMCVLQDFEALSPNYLCRTIETVSGGGLILLLLNNMTSLRQLYTLTMEFHSKFKSFGRGDLDIVQPRFNERLTLSLAKHSSILLLDDELNVLPLTADNLEANSVQIPAATESGLAAVLQKTRGSPVLGPLTALALTVDQANAIGALVEILQKKRMDTTATLIAPRGRGKSAALGLILSAAIGYSYSNIFVTAPAPENVNVVFEFAIKGMNELGLKEVVDYDLVRADEDGEFNGALIRISVHQKHRQTIQYISPRDAALLTHAELVVVDEAAAIPLHLVRSLIGPHLVVLSSTVTGYEGTGRALSLKLIEELRTGKCSTDYLRVPRALEELKLTVPIRYAEGDPIENWLNKLLCLDAVEYPTFQDSLRPAYECELFEVNRDALFAYHDVSEEFLRRIMSLFVASHYKNSPDDLQYLADAPHHRLFVLTPPIVTSDTLPDVYVAVQVALEGAIAEKSAAKTLAGGTLPAGDLIPWTLAQNSLDANFASLSGARIVRIATHPRLQKKLGYGSRALASLLEFFSHGGADEPKQENEPPAKRKKTGAMDSDAPPPVASLLVEELAVRETPPLLAPCEGRTLPRPQVDYLGTCFGLDTRLASFWQKNGYAALHISQRQNDMTGEYSAVFLRPLATPAAESPEWFTAKRAQFTRRLVPLLGGSLRSLDTRAALLIVNSSNKDDIGTVQLSRHQIEAYFDEHDIARLEAYVCSAAKDSLIIDLIPTIASLHFSGRLQLKPLQPMQAAVLMGLGVKRLTNGELSVELNIPVNQVLAMLQKVVMRFVKRLGEIE